MCVYLVTISDDSSALLSRAVLAMGAAAVYMFSSHVLQLTCNNTGWIFRSDVFTTRVYYSTFLHSLRFFLKRR